jgi:hypothetical protein
MVDERYALGLLEWSQGMSLLAFAVSVEGSRDGFPALLGVSVRSRRRGVVDLMPNEVERPGIMVCLIEHPEELGDVDDVRMLRYRGEVTFALWRDRTYQSELARVPWCNWEYHNLWSPNPSNRIDPNTAAYVSKVEVMRLHYPVEPCWTARRLNEG